MFGIVEAYSLLCLIITVKGQKLLQAQVTIRHGARTPVHGTWNPSNLSEGQMGKLSPAGIRQHFVLGQLLNTNYIKEQQLLVYPINFNEISVQSTEFSRTMQSAQTLLYSMFLRNESALIDDKVLGLSIPPQRDIDSLVLSHNLTSLPLGFWPIPIKVTPANLDYMLLPYSCQYVQQFSTQNQQSKEYSDVNQEWQKFFDSLREKQFFVQDLSEAGGLADDIGCSITNGDIQPNLSQLELETLNFTKSVYYQIILHRTYEQVRFLITPFIKSVLSNFKNRNLKFKLNSAHDTNLFLILNFLNLTNWQCINHHAKSIFPYFEIPDNTTQQCQIVTYPEFASQAIFELWSNDEKVKDEGLFVKFKYNGVYYPICANQGLTCPYLEFIELLKGLEDQSFITHCQKPLSESLNIQKLAIRQKSSSFNAFILFVFIIPFICITIALFLVGYIYFRRYQMLIIAKKQEGIESTVQNLDI